MNVHGTTTNQRHAGGVGNWGKGRRGGCGECKCWHVSKWPQSPSMLQVAARRLQQITTAHQRGVFSKVRAVWQRVAVRKA